MYSLETSLEFQALDHSSMRDPEFTMVSATALIVTEKGGAFQQREVELDTLQPKEVLVKLTATGICHTDLKVQHAKITVPLPAILGHEGRHMHSDRAPPIVLT